MTALVFLRGRLIEVNPPGEYLVLEWKAVSEATARLTEFVESWPSMSTEQRARELRLALFDVVTVAVSDESRGAVWVDALARHRVMPKKQLRETITERCELIRNVALLYADNPKQVEDAICKLILN